MMAPDEKELIVKCKKDGLVYRSTNFIAFIVEEDGIQVLSSMLVDQNQLVALMLAEVSNLKEQAQAYQAGSEAVKSFQNQSPN